MSSDGNHRQVKTLLKDCVDEDESFDGAIHEQARIFFDQVGFAAVTGGEVEVSLLNEKFFHSGQHLGSVTVAELGDEHAHGKRLALAKRSGKEAWPVVEFRRGLRSEEHTSELQSLRH